MFFLARSFVVRVLAELEGDEYISAVASGVEEARKLLEVGFEFICTHKDEMLFRKRK
jgi:hypothetical protein